MIVMMMREQKYVSASSHLIQEFLDTSLNRMGQLKLLLLHEGFLLNSHNYPLIEEIDKH